MTAITAYVERDRIMNAPVNPSRVFPLATAVGLLAGGCGLFGPDEGDRIHAVFEDGQAQEVPEFSDSSRWIREELWVETEFDSDGDGRPDRMHVAVVRPEQTKTEGLKVPVIYESSPYDGGTATDAEVVNWSVQVELGETPPPRGAAPTVETTTAPGISSREVDDWVPRGFAVVHSEAPGTGLSEGCPAVGGPNEGLAPKAVIDWLNGRARGYTSVDGGQRVDADWSTGRVGMTGSSYLGSIAMAAASTGVDGLKAVLAMATVNSWYRYYRSNGLVRSPGGYPGEDADVYYDYINSGYPDRRPYCNATYRDGTFAAGIDRVTGDYNDFWADRDLLPKMGQVRAAVMLYHGFNDWNVMPGQAVKAYEALRAAGASARVYLHDQAHIGYPPPELTNRWFTHYLYGVDNGVEYDPKALIVPDGGDPWAPIAYADYPNPDAVSVTLHPGAGGAATGTLRVSQAAGQGTETLVDDVSFDPAQLAEATSSEHRLLYATGVLGSDVHISGTPRITVRMASSKAAANLSVYLVALPWGDGALPWGDVITRGWADPQNRVSLSQSDPLVPGTFYDVTFELQPDDQTIPAGESIGLMIFSSDRDFTLWPAPGTELTVDLDGTSIDLPVVGGGAALAAAIGG